VPVYCLHRVGVAPLREAYTALVRELRPDTVLLVDGGTDSLMRGDEAGLGTPQEDMASVAAVASLAMPRKLLACIGFGVDTFHGVCHAHFLEAVAELTRSGGYLGCFSVTADMPEAALYREATESVFADMPHHPSIVNASILSALAGSFGDHHTTARTAGSRLFINPLMPVYWTFHLDAVARRVLYLDALRQTQTWGDVTAVIAAFRASAGSPRPWAEIPL
jgi:hypothetical protein